MLRQHSGGSSVISLGCAMARAANLRVAFDSGCQPHGADLASGKDELRRSANGWMFARRCFGEPCQRLG